jgi:NADH-ubiquinone oxidoreductase chain 4
MAVVMLGIFSLTAAGIEGSIFLQIAHGIVSSALFIIVTLLYDRQHTRIVKYYRGVVITMPIFAIFFFIFTLANIGVPLSCNFVGEIVSLLAIYNSNPFLGIFGSLGMVLSACYALFLYNRVIFGSPSPYINYQRDLTRREYFILLPLVILTIYLGIYPAIVFDLIHYSVMLLII